MGRIGAVIPALVMCGLLVSACSPPGSAAPGKTRPARVPTRTVRIGRLTQIFDTSYPADPAQASAVEGFRAATTRWDKSQETWTLVSPVTAYVTGGALRNLKASLGRLKATDVVPGGTDRFFKTRAVISGASATITTCDDGSMFEEVNRSTGVPDPAYSAPASQQYLFETWQMVRLGARWALSAISVVTLPDSRAKPCQP
jgi:hypothetical protein